MDGIKGTAVNQVVVRIERTALGATLAVQNAPDFVHAKHMMDNFFKMFCNHGNLGCLTSP